jgi:hypothetical protein
MIVDIETEKMQTDRSFDSDDMTRGGFRENAGRPSAFPGTTAEKPFYMDFTPDGHKAMAVLTKRAGLSRNSVIAHLVERHADALVSPDDVTVYEGKRAANVMTIRLPRRLRGQLKAAHRRTGRSYSDIGETLVRQFSRGETWPVLPENLPRRRKRGRRG